MVERHEPESEDQPSDTLLSDFYRRRPKTALALLGVLAGLVGAALEHRAETLPPSKPSLAAARKVLADQVKVLEDGGQVRVSALPLLMPSTKSLFSDGQPIVFVDNGYIFAAYRENSPPSFNAAPSRTAQSMTIASISGYDPAPLLTDIAYIDKAGYLIDGSTGADVGYTESLNNDSLARLPARD